MTKYNATPIKNDNRCPKCHGSRLFIDSDIRARADRKYCPLYGYSKWFCFGSRNPSASDTGNRGFVRDRYKFPIINGVAMR